MAFTALLTDTLTVKRLSAGAGVQRTYTSPGAYSAMVQPLDAEQAQYRGLVTGKSYKAFTDVNANIAGGDWVTDQNSVEYRVQGVEKRTYGNYPHLEIILIQEEA